MQHNFPMGPIQLDSSTAIRMTMGGKMNHERALMARIDIWHKIKIIRGAQYDKETIFKAILQTVAPADLIPVDYQICGEDSTFIVRNCSVALENLCKASLIIKNANGDPLVLLLILGIASATDLKINLQPLLLRTVTKRYDAKHKTLNLEYFHRDPNIDNHVYCPLSQLRTSNHVLKLAKSSLPPVEHLNLRYNEMSNLSAIENSNLTFIRYLDLRHNNLYNMNMLSPLKNLKIIKLWLDGNPLCENYSSAKQYIKSAKKYCPHLQELDSACIVPNMPLIYRDYFMDNKKRSLVHQFASHFFNLFDQTDRTVLRGLYHKNAIYSMSFAISAAIAQKIGVGHYVASRNLVRKSGKAAKNAEAKKLLHIHHGEDDIFTAFSRLPKTYHDKNSFKYDVMYDDDKCLVIGVTGLFKKLSAGINVLSFNRTFVISASFDNEYHILNDQCHIDAAPTEITPDKIVVSVSYDEIVPNYFSPNEKSTLVTRFEQVTTLNKEWCETYLSEAQWDMKKAITNFMKDYKSAAVPKIAFDRCDCDDT